MSSIVYFIRDLSTGYTKIGWTVDVNRRLYQLQNHNVGVHVSPFGSRYYKLLFYVKDCHPHIEFEVQKVARKISSAYRGEWFLLSDSQIKNIKNDLLIGGCTIIEH